MASVGFWQGMAQGTSTLGKAMQDTKKRKSRMNELELQSKSKVEELNLKDEFKTKQFEREEDNKVKNELTIVAMKGVQAYNQSLARGESHEQARLRSKGWLDQGKQILQMNQDAMKRLGITGNINLDVVEDVNRKKFISMQSGDNYDNVAFIDSGLMDSAETVKDASKAVFGLNIKGMANVDVMKYLEKQGLDPALAPQMLGRRTGKAPKVKTKQELDKLAASANLKNAKADVIIETGIPTAQAKIKRENAKAGLFNVKVREINAKIKKGEKISTKDKRDLQKLHLAGVPVTKLSGEGLERFNKFQKSIGEPTFKEEDFKKAKKANFNQRKIKLNTMLNLLVGGGEAKKDENGNVTYLSNKAKKKMNKIIKDDLGLDAPLLAMMDGKVIPEDQQDALKWIQKTMSSLQDTFSADGSKPSNSAMGNAKKPPTKKKLTAAQKMFQRMKDSAAYKARK